MAFRLYISRDISKNDRVATFFSSTNGSAYDVGDYFDARPFKLGVRRIKNLLHFITEEAGDVVFNTVVELDMKANTLMLGIEVFCPLE